MGRVGAGEGDGLAGEESVGEEATAVLRVIVLPVAVGAMVMSVRARGPLLRETVYVPPCRSGVSVVRLRASVMVDALTAEMVYAVEAVLSFTLPAPLTTSVWPTAKPSVRKLPLLRVIVLVEELIVTVPTKAGPRTSEPSGLVRARAKASMVNRSFPALPSSRMAAWLL